MKFHFNEKTKIGTSGGRSSGNRMQGPGRKEPWRPGIRSARHLLLTLLFLFPVVAFLLLVRGISSKLEATSPSEGVGLAEASEPARSTAVDITVKKNDTFYTIMSALGLPPVEIALVSEEAGRLYDLASVKEGDRLRVVKSGESVVAIEYLYDRLEGLKIARKGDGGFRAESYEVPHRVVPTLVSGSIQSSLYEAGVSAGADPRVIMELSDIFAWDVDFSTEIRKGDTFSILFETVYVGDEPVSIGRVLGAEVVNSGSPYTAIYYKDREGNAEYFDADGRSLRRVLLKSPLRYRRISSHFTKKRYHPVLKRYRPHHGIDYAAPHGTPVEASGEGRVVFAGWKKGYGNFVEIRHNAIYTTAYGHFSRIGKGIRKGAQVRQGDVIGYVGSTGISTGPHLHYEVRVRGQVVDPLTVKSRPGRTLSKEEMPSFNEFKNQITAKLAQKPTTLASLSEK